MPLRPKRKQFFEISAAVYTLEIVSILKIKHTK